MTAFDKNHDISNLYNLSLSSMKLKCSDDDCVFRIALIIFHNICSCGLIGKSQKIPTFIWKLLNKYGKTGFKNCWEICASLSAVQIQEFWELLIKIGRPLYFLHINTDHKLTPKSHNAHIQFNFDDEVDSIKTTATGKELIIDYELLEKALLKYKEKGKKLYAYNDGQGNGINKEKKKGMKFMLYNNKYKSWGVDRIFGSQSSPFCKEYIKKQAENLCVELTEKYNVTECYVKYAVNNLLSHCNNYNYYHVKKLLVQQDIFDRYEHKLKNTEIMNSAILENEEEQNDEELCDAIKVISSYNNNRISLNAIFKALDVQKFYDEKIRYLMDYSFECKRDDHVIHTFQILTAEDDEWVKDGERAGCGDKKCKIFFDSVNRRHHCRGCGEIFCSDHLFYLPFKRNISYDTINDKLRGNKKEKEKAMKDVNDEEYVKICEKCKEFYWYFIYKSPNTSQGLPYLI